MEDVTNSRIMQIEKIFVPTQVVLSLSFLLGLLRFSITSDFTLILFGMLPVTIIISVLPMILFKYGRVMIAAWVQVFPIWLFLTIGIYFLGGFHSRAFTGYVVVILLSAIYFDNKVTGTFIIASILNGIIVVVLQQNDQLPPSLINNSPVGSLVTLMLIFISSSFLISVLSTVRNQALDETVSLQQENVILDRRREVLENLQDTTNIMAHDFKNILFVISYNLEIIKMKTKDLQQKQTSFETIEDTIERATQRINNLLKFSQTENIEIETLSVSLFSKTMKSLLQMLCRDEISFSVEYTTDCLFHANQEILHDIGINLIINSLEAIEAEGQIRINQRCVELSQDNSIPTPNKIKSGRFEIFEFCDDGPGISDLNMAKIFNPYFTTKPDGTGLGLASIWGIMVSLGGFITCQSELGKFTRFYLAFPHVS